MNDTSGIDGIFRPFGAPSRVAAVPTVYAVGYILSRNPALDNV
jgi:hypothetical protein